MAEATTPQRGAAAANEGFFEHSRALLAALAEYFHARLRLAGTESKEALVHYGIIIGLAVGALVVVVFGYLFFCIGLAVLLAHLLRIHPGWVILIFALIHFAVAIVCLLIARARLTAPMFTGTISELKKDQQWMSTSKPS